MAICFPSHIFNLAIDLLALIGGTVVDEDYYTRCNLKDSYAGEATDAMLDRLDRLGFIIKYPSDVAEEDQFKITPSGLTFKEDGLDVMNMKNDDPRKRAQGEALARDLALDNERQQSREKL